MSEYSLLLDSPPQNWRSVNFGELCIRVQYSATPSANGERLYLGLEHLASGFPILVGRGKESDVCSGKTAFSSGDVLFGKLRPYLRKSVLMKESGICSTDILVFRANEICIPEFLCFLTHTDEFVGHAKATTSGVQHPRTSWSGLREFKLHVPPVSEQKKIIGILGVIQRSIAQQERLITITSELKSALMHKLFTEGLRSEKQKETEIGPIPESWKELTLDKTGDVVYGIQAAVASNLKPIGMKILTNKNITLDGQIVLEDINFFELKTKRHYETVLKIGDILFNWRSGSKEHIGKTAYFDLDGCYTHSSFILRVRPKDNVNGRFLFWYLYFLRKSGFFIRKHNVSSVNTTFNKSAVNALSVFLPSGEEQQEIASILDIANNELNLYKRKKDIYEELFRTLLHQLMTAQIRVNDLNIDEFLITEPT